MPPDACVPGLTFPPTRSATAGVTPGVGCRATIIGIRAGSAIVDTTIQFLVSNGNTDAATAMQEALADPASVLPPATWGPSSVLSLDQGEETITVPPELLTAPGSSDDNTALIVGLAVGREWPARRVSAECAADSLACPACGQPCPCTTLADMLAWACVSPPLLQWAAAPWSSPASASGCGAPAAAAPGPSPCTATSSPLPPSPRRLAHILGLYLAWKQPISVLTEPTALNSTELNALFGPRNNTLGRRRILCSRHQPA